jgi:hypothetical protein
LKRLNDYFNITFQPDLFEILNGKSVLKGEVFGIKYARKYTICQVPVWLAKRSMKLSSKFISIIQILNHTAHGYPIWEKTRNNPRTKYISLGPSGYIPRGFRIKLSLQCGALFSIQMSWSQNWKTCCSLGMKPWHLDKSSHTQQLAITSDRHRLEFLEADSGNVERETISLI